MCQETQCEDQFIGLLYINYAHVCSTMPHSKVLIKYLGKDHIR